MSVLAPNSVSDRNKSHDAARYRNRVRLRKVQNVVMLGLCGLAAALAIVVLGLVLYFLVLKGIPALNVHLFTRVPNHVVENQGGISQSILGTVTLITTASLFGLPIGILGGIYQVEAKGWFASTVRFLTDVLSGIPSIVIGIFVYAVWVFPISQKFHQSGYSAYAGGFALGIMMVPTVMRTTEEMLRLVPNSLREASLALGATRWRTMLTVVLPSARGGIVTGVMLALARIAGETAPLLFTIFGSEFYSTHHVRLRLLAHHVKFTVPTLNAPVDAIPLRIYNYSQSPIVAQQNIAWAGALILISLILILSIAARFATRSKMLQEK